MPYSDYLKPRSDVLKPEGVEGIIDIARADGASPGAIEANASEFFNLTFPTSDIKRVAESLNNRFNAKEKASGLFLFEALKGSGKSHLLLLIYHIFKNPSIAQQWFASNGIEIQIPQSDYVVVLNKFTDNPQEKLWNLIFDRLGHQRYNGNTHPQKEEIIEAIGNRRLICIFDELEMGIRCISDPAIRAQNIGFLQQLSEAGNRDTNITLFASVYSDQEEPGSTLKRVPRLEVRFQNVKDNSAVILHRLFENFARLDREKVQLVIESYINLWKRNCSIDADKLRQAFEASYPFSPSLMNIVQQRIPKRGGFQNVRGALAFLGNLVRLTHAGNDIITPCDATLADRGNSRILSDLDVGGQLIDNAFQNANELISRFPDSHRISAATLLYTLTATGNQRGATKEELVMDMLNPAHDINEIERTLQAFPKYASYFHSDNGRYFFDVEENADAKIEFKSINCSDEKAASFLRETLQNNVFGDPSSSAIYTDNDAEMKTALSALAKNRLRYVLATRKLTQEERHNLYFGLDKRNLVILIEPKDGSFALEHDRDLIKWAKRIVAARDLISGTTKGSKKDEYEKIAHADLNNIIDRIKRVGAVYMHWEEYGDTVLDDIIEAEPLSGDCTKDRILEYLSNHLYPPQVFKEHLEFRIATITGKTVGQIEEEYRNTITFPVPAVVSAVQKGLIELCKDGIIGIRHQRGNFCGDRPHLSEQEMSKAEVTAPWEREGPASTGTEPCRICGATPCVCGKPTATLDSGEKEKEGAETCKTCGKDPCVCIAKQTVEERIPGKGSAGQLKQEVAFKLLHYETGIITRARYKIFFEQRNIADLSDLPAAIRGNLTGCGDATFEIVIGKVGRYTKSDIEIQIEQLPVLPGATYAADLSIETETGHES